jgi:two-component system, chemotaxis family, protein-glutamate methylesterase/glutaminase
LPQKDIVVIGGSAGSLQSLKTIVANLPPDFPASVLVVIHTAPDSPSMLAHLLSKFGPLPAKNAVNGRALKPGQIYVALPDRHLTIEDGRVHVERGPRENRHRPAIDPLFRSAAREYGPRVVGIVLSGLRDDGAAGLFAVKQRGGIAIAQDPDEAAWSEMPARAIAYAAPQYVLRAEQIAPHLVQLVNTNSSVIAMPNKNGVRQRFASQSKTPKTLQESDAGVERPDRNLEIAHFEEGEGVPSVFACPECHGVLWELKDDRMVRFRCRVGHAYGIESLRKEMSESAERALWAAMRALEEKAASRRRAAENFAPDKRMVKRLLDQSSADDVNARTIRAMIFRRDEVLDKEKKHRKAEAEAQRRKTA